jgi:hypothetical protein
MQVAESSHQIHEWADREFRFRDEKPNKNKCLRAFCFRAAQWLLLVIPGRERSE